MPINWLGGFLHDVYAQTSLLGMFGKWFDLNAARYLFDEMPVKSLVSWSSMISAHCRYLQVEGEFLLLKQMRAADRAQTLALLLISFLGLGCCLMVFLFMVVWLNSGVFCCSCVQLL